MIDAESAWHLARDDFAPDGALRDIRVRNANLGDWNQIIALIRNRCSDVAFIGSGESTELPTELSHRHFSGGDQHGNVTFTAGQVRLIAYLFSLDDIEISFDPSDVQGPAVLADVLEFVRYIGRELGKRVDVTPENTPDAPIFSFDPRDQSIRFVPAEPRPGTPSATNLAITSLEGPVEALDGRLLLRIPLSEGGAALTESARGISDVIDDELHVFIPDWLAEALNICEGSIVVIDNRNGKFNITPEKPS